MLRSLHRWPGLIAALFLIILSLSGAVLSVLPAAESVTAVQPAPMSVADLTSRILATHPGVEQIRRAPSGKITAYWFQGGTPGAAIIDPNTGTDIATADPSAFVVWLTELHRSLLLGDWGRYATALAAAAMLILAATGTMMIARRMGGWSRWFARSRGPGAGRLHLDLARVAILGLILSSATALYMTASTFNLLPDASANPMPPDTVSGTQGIAPAAIPLLQSTPLTTLRELTFPYPDDATDVFTLKTDTVTAQIDQGTGATLAEIPFTTWEGLSETIYMLHTGQGASVLGLILGLMALTIPALAVTGTITWAAGRRSRPRIAQNASAAQAETVLLIASEGGTTWGFAATLHAALTSAGQKVHAAPLASYAPSKYTHAKRLIIMAATYGDGDAPASARNVLPGFAAPNIPTAILGFGDHSFPQYCAFAQRLADACTRAPQLLPYDTIDRQSPQDFARWGRALGTAIGLDLNLVHVPKTPPTHSLTLTQRTDFGAEVQAPTAILRFALPPKTLWQRLTGQGLTRFAAGDLIGVLPQGSDVPRFYSLASATTDGFAEICVRKHVGGLCSAQLMDLALGDTVRASIRPNPSFRPNKGKAPVILIGAGTGIGPLAGFIRANRRHRPMHLFFGARHPASDMLYGADLATWTTEHRLTTLTTAFSRTKDRAYVQDALRRDATHIAALITQGAQILVCGGRDMVGGVQQALTDILAPMGLTPATLKAQGRYAEDVY